uniref:Integrase catalytic domain-containing protein n=1 Tax=Phytophthora ramorum TaxID=164328 RepID=H3G5W6_PHYRM
QSISMDFVFGLPQDNKRRTGIVVFVDRFSKMVHLAAVPAEVTAKQTACLFVDMVFRHHSTSCRIGIRALQRDSGKKCLHFLGRSCPCRLRITRRPTDKQSVST